MCIDEVNLLKLGDYVKYSADNKSDEYFMVTGVDENIKLRKLGDKELIIIEDLKDLEDYSKVNTTRLS